MSEPLDLDALEAAARTGDSEIDNATLLALIERVRRAEAALRSVSNAYGCFAGCTGALPGAPPDGSGHTPACAAARVALDPEQASMSEHEHEWVYLERGSDDTKIWTCECGAQQRTCKCCGAPADGPPRGPCAGHGTAFATYD